MTKLIPNFDTDQLPHGSGINCDWHTTATSKDGVVNKITFSNSYHAMDEMGGYVGYVDFQVHYTPTGEYIDIDVDVDDCLAVGEDFWTLEDYLSECMPDQLVESDE